MIYLSNGSKAQFEQKVNKILREFDRAITEAKGKLRIDKFIASPFMTLYV